MMSSTAPTAAAASHPSATPDLLGGDLLSMGGPSSDSSDLMSMFGSSSPSSAVGLMEDPTTIPSSLASFPTVAYDTPVSADSTVSVTHAKVFKPEGVVVVLFYKNLTQAAVPGVSTTLDVPSHLMPMNETPPTFLVNLGPGGTAQQVLAYTSQSIMTGTSVKATFSYTGGVRIQKGYFSIPVVASDLIRSSVFTTPEFGAAWEGPGMAASHRTQTIAGAVFKSADGFIQALAEKLHLNPVEVIGKEVILCGQILLNPATKCLVHGKVKASAIEVSVRSSSAQYSQAVMMQCAAICQGK